MKPLKSDGTTTTTVPAPEERIAGEELWLPPGGSAGMVVTEQTALQLPSLLAAVNTLATDVALLPLGVYQRAADGGRREAREHPADRLVRVSPDGQTTPLRWRQSWMLHALLHGNGYAEIQRTGRGAPYALHLLDPRTTCARRVDDRPGYQLDGGRWLEAANVLHLAGLGFDGLTGFNFVRLLREAIGLGMGAQSYAADYFQNGAEPGGVIETPGKLNPEGRANLRDGWHGRHGGPGNRHSVAVLEQGAKWVGISVDPEKSQLNETRKYQLLDTIRPWRLPPHKAGDFSQAHLANIEASNLDYLMTAMMGWVTGIEQECTFKLLTMGEQAAGFYIEANTNALLRGDTSQRNASYEVALRNGWMSRNEVRRRENLDPIPADAGGDLYTVQSQNIPLSEVGKERPPKPPIAATPPGLRHNPNHGADGKFSSGGGGHHAGSAPAPASASSTAGDAEAGVRDLGFTTGLGRQFSDTSSPVTDKNKQDMVDYQERHYGDWAKSLSDKETSALGSYVGGGYTATNKQLRDGELKPAIATRVRRMDSALAKASAPEDVVAFRGIRDLRAVTGVGPKDAESLVGATIRDKGYLSMSLDRSTASSGFFRNRDDGAVLVVSIPKGAKVAGADPIVKQKDPAVNLKHYEHEMLAARGHGLQVTQVARKGDETFLYANLVPPAE